MINKNYPLPNIPEGFRRLRARDTIREGDLVDFSYADPESKFWEPVFGRAVSERYRPGVNLPMIRPIKRHAAKPAPAKAKRAGKPVKARIAYGLPNGNSLDRRKHIAQYYAGFSAPKVARFFVVPADAESVEQMVEQVAEAIYNDGTTRTPRYIMDKMAAKFLAAIGIKA